MIVIKNEKISIIFVHELNICLSSLSKITWKVILHWLVYCNGAYCDIVLYRMDYFILEFS